MKLIATALSIVALLSGCAGTGQLPVKIQKLAIAPGTTKPVTVLAPQKAAEFITFASGYTGFVDAELRTGTQEAMATFGRYQHAGADADAQIVFEQIRHGVTKVAGDLFAPTVEAVAHITGPDGKKIATRRVTSTSGEIQTLSGFQTQPQIYRDALDIAVDKLAAELVSGL